MRLRVLTLALLAPQEAALEVLWSAAHTSLLALLTSQEAALEVLRLAALLLPS